MSLVGKIGAAPAEASALTHQVRDPKMGWVEDRAMKESLFFTQKP